MLNPKNEIFEKKYIILLAITLLTTYSIHRTTTGPDSPILSPNHWFNDDELIEQILRKKVDTNYTFIDFSQPAFTSSNGILVPFFADYDIWYRHFNFYPYDPETTPDTENYRIDGIIFIDGRIRIYGHVPADWYYI